MLGYSFMRSKVASTGNHSWILSEDLLTNEFESNLVPEYPDEWLPQFATGIKTIVLIPVAQHGILQLGSSKKVGENSTLVALVKDKFNAYLNNLDVGPTSSVELQKKTSPLPISKLNMDELSSGTVWQMKPEDPAAVTSVRQADYNASTTNQLMPVNRVEDTSYTSGENRVDNGFNSSGNDVGYLYASLYGIPLYHDVVPEKSNIANVSLSVEGMESLSYLDYNSGIFGGDSMVEAELVVPYVDENTDGMANIHSLFSFPMDCELHKALGSTFQTSSSLHPRNLAVCSEYSQSSSSDLIDRKCIQGNEPSSWEPREYLVNREEEHIWGAVYATIDSCLSDDISIAPSLSKEPNDAKSWVESLGPLPPSTNECIYVNKRGVPRCSQTINGPIVPQSLPPFPTENILSTLTNEKKMKKGYKYPQAKKGSKVCRKRSEPGLSPKPRDRQLIQDRVKELRELVPSGSRCSIDGLLDRTISHMLFLRGISERAGKLRHWVNQEITVRKKMRLSSPEPDSKNGTSWAFELGSDFHVCPIVVKDLDYPGHMLIEMLCNDTGLFLEIAEVIGYLNLKILKGAMESHASNTWAHFIVEVSKEFQRLDIFWPLMQILQKDRIPVSNQN